MNVKPATVLDVIEALDFEPDVACESTTAGCVSRPEHQADWYIVSHCRGVVPMCDTNVKRRLRDVRSGWFHDSRCCTCGAGGLPLRPYPVIGPVRP